VHARDAAQARRALWPIALGQLASVVVLAGALSLRLSLNRALMGELAVALLAAAAAAAAWRALRRGSARTRLGGRIGHAGIALWSFLIASAQGAGLMLVPALVPLCVAGAAPAPGIEGCAALAAAGAAVAVHIAAMLLVTGVLASGFCRIAGAHRRLRLPPGSATAAVTDRGAPPN
jgi:hypothetical protein